MSKVERSNGRPGRPLFRWVAAGSAAVFLLSSAYSVSWGQDIDDIYDDDDGLSAAEIAAIAIGGLAVGYGAWLLLGGSDDDDDEEEQKVQLPGGVNGSTARLVPTTGGTTLGAGERVVFDLQVREGDQWVSVTEREGASISLSGNSALVRQDGTKNSFCLPITAAAKGEQVTVEGRFQRPDGTALVATTPVQLAAN